LGINVNGNGNYKSHLKILNPIFPSFQNRVATERISSEDDNLLSYILSPYFETLTESLLQTAGNLKLKHIKLY